MEKTLVEICATVVTAQAQSQQMTSEEITQSIRIVYGALDGLNRADDHHHQSDGTANGVYDELAALRHQPTLTLQKACVICLECGKKFRLLSNRHLALHGLTPRGYKRKWGFRMTTSLSAQTLTRHRRKIAKQQGMGKGLADWRAARKQLTG